MEQFDRELVIYSAQSNQMHCLNEPAALIWTLCDGSRSLSAVVEELALVVGAEPSAVKVTSGMPWQRSEGSACSDEG